MTNSVRALAFTVGILGLATGCGSSTATGSDGGAGKGDASDAGGSGSGGTAGKGDASAAGGSGGGGAKGTTTVSRCDIDMPATADMGEFKECIEYAVGYTASADKGCAILKGTYSTGACDLTGSSGGCKQVIGAGTMTSYYYTVTLSTDAVMSQCAADGNATYVAP